MAIVVNINSGKEFEKVSEGLHSAVLADVVELFDVPTKFGLKDRIRLVWIVNENDTEGRPKRVFETFNRSLHESASLTERVLKLTTKPIAEIATDLDQLLGTQKKLVIQHNMDKTDPNKIYANIEGTMAADPKVVVRIPADFVRAKDKPAKVA